MKNRIFSTICIAIAAATAAYADGTINGVEMNGKCLYDGVDAGIVPEPGGTCQTLSTWRLVAATPVEKDGKFYGLECMYERDADGNPSFSIGVHRECHDVLLVDRGKSIAGLYFHYGHDMRDFYVSPCDIYDQKLKYNAQALKQLPMYRKQMEYRLSFQWKDARRECATSGIPRESPRDGVTVGR